MANILIVSVFRYLKKLFVFSVRLDLGSILGGIANAGQQQNNNNKPNNDPLGSLINQGINLVASNPDIQQGILNAAGINGIQVPRPNQVTPSTQRPVTQGMLFKLTFGTSCTLSNKSFCKIYNLPFSGII